MDIPNESILSTVLKSHEKMSPNSKKRTQNDVEAVMNDILDNEPGPSQSTKRPKPCAKYHVISSDDDDDLETANTSGIKRELFSKQKQSNPKTVGKKGEKEDFVSTVLNKFHNLSPEVKEETKDKVNDFVNSILKEEHVTTQSSRAELKGWSKVQEHVTTQSSSDEEDLTFRKSRLHQDLLDLSSHGSCDAKVEANLSPETGVVAKKQGRGAHCGNKKCHKQLSVNETTVIMIGMYGKLYKKVYFCCSADCIKNRHVQDAIKDPKQVLVSCTLHKTEKKRALKEFPDASISPCKNSH